MQVQDQRSELLGLTEKAIERIVNSEPTINFSRSKAAHDNMAMVASRMLKLIEENLETEDPEPDDAN